MLDHATVCEAAKLLANGVSHFEIARDLQICLGSVEWIEQGKHPKLRPSAAQTQVRKRRGHARKSQRVPAKQREQVTTVVTSESVGKRRELLTVSSSPPTLTVEEAAREYATRKRLLAKPR